MKKIAYMSLFALATMALGSSLKVLAENSEVSGTMMVVKGDVKVTSAKLGKTDPAKVGTKVFSGDTIQSGADSRAKIVMSDKNVLNISPDSKITIAKYENDPTKDSRNVELKVDYGKVRASVEQKYDGEKNKFNIRTPTAVAGVRGTDFVTGFNATTQQTRIITFSGVVAAGQPGPQGQILNAVFVKPGMSTSIESGKPPEPPRPVSKEDMKKAEQDVADGKGKGKSMLASSDLDPKNNPVDKDGGQKRGIASGPDDGPPPFPPTPPGPPNPTQNQFLDNAIKNQKSRVNVKIVPQ